MTTPWVDIVDARIDSDSPVPFDLTTDIRNDLQHLKERADQVGVHTLAGIHDDFTAITIDSVQGTPGLTDYPITWELPSGGASSAPTLVAAPDHAAQFTLGAPNKFSGLAASKYRMQFGLARDHTIYGEFRHKSGTSSAADVWLWGFQDASLVFNVQATVTTQNNIIAFVQDGTAQKYKARCVKGGAGVDVATALGNAANWTVLRIEITFAGATKKVEFFVDGTSVGSTTDTTKIPTVNIRPMLACAAAGARTDYIDYADFDWIVRPLSN